MICTHQRWIILPRPLETNGLCTVKCYTCVSTTSLYALQASGVPGGSNITGKIWEGGSNKVSYYKKRKKGFACWHAFEKLNTIICIPLMGRVASFPRREGGGGVFLGTSIRSINDSRMLRNFPEVNKKSSWGLY